VFLSRLIMVEVPCVAAVFRSFPSRNQATDSTHETTPIHALRVAQRIFLILFPHGPYVPSARVRHLIDEVIAPTSASLELDTLDVSFVLAHGLPDGGPVKTSEIGL
jgi:hypothetical protein